MTEERPKGREFLPLVFIVNYLKYDQIIIIIIMTSTQVVKMSVNVTTNIPSQDYTHSDN